MKQKKKFDKQNPKKNAKISGSFATKSKEIRKGSGLYLLYMKVIFRRKSSLAKNSSKGKRDVLS